VTKSRLTLRQRLAIRSSSVFFGLLTLVWFPLFFLYGWALCLLAWFLWVSPKHHVIVVTNGQTDGSLDSLQSSLKNRAVFLDYAERKCWSSSIPGLLFRFFGPRVTAEFLIPGLLPTVIVIRKYRKPVNFGLGNRSGNYEAELARLRLELTKD
jgi:hypothetical protein